MLGSPKISFSRMGGEKQPERDRPATLKDKKAKKFLGLTRGENLKDIEHSPIKGDFTVV